MRDNKTVQDVGGPRMITVKQIVIWICEPCLNGQGHECHTPGCALWLHRVDLPIPPEVYTVVAEREEKV